MPADSALSLAGTVSDVTGAVIPGATVSATASTRKLTRTATSDVNGHFVIEGLTPGAYSVKTQARGFQQQLTQGVSVSSAQPNVADIVLSVGAAVQTVTVEAESTAQDVLRSPEPPATTPLHGRQSPPPVFEITTESGERWTSPDGINWKHK